MINRGSGCLGSHFPLLITKGNAEIVEAASTTILGFRSGGVGRQGWRLLELVLGLLALVYIARSRWVYRVLTEPSARPRTSTPGPAQPRPCRPARPRR